MQIYAALPVIFVRWFFLFRFCSDDTIPIQLFHSFHSNSIVHYSIFCYSILGIHFHSFHYSFNIDTIYSVVHSVIRFLTCYSIICLLKLFSDHDTIPTFEYLFYIYSYFWNSTLVWIRLILLWVTYFYRSIPTWFSDTVHTVGVPTFVVLIILWFYIF